MSFDFALEHFDDVIDEMQPLLEVNHQEIASNQDIPLNIDRDKYRAIQNNGALKIFTARRDGLLIGYAVFFVSCSLQRMQSLQAVQDVIFIEKRHRGFGMKFINMCDLSLKFMGVQVVYQNVNVNHDWGKVLLRLGYEPLDLVYFRRLDKMKG